MANFNYQDFYKIGNDIYRTNGQKLTYAEALPMFQSGFNAAFIPERQPVQQQVQPSLSESGKYYKSGNDVYEAGTNRHIELDEFQRLGLNFALLPEGQAPTQQIRQPSPVITPQVPDTGDPVLNQLLQANQAYLDNLVAQGKTINPNVEITPEQTAKFLTQAQGEISPYYANQMKLAREGLLRQAGYTSDEINRLEAETERKYGQGVRQIAETSAETGFAQSGRRQLQEQNLAQDTQSAIESNRRRLEFEAGNQARQIAGEWGKEAIPSYNIGSTPRVLAGSETFGRTLDTKPFYSISDSVLDNLIGTQRYNEQAQTKSRAFELENLYRQTEANRQRSLAL